MRINAAFALLVLAEGCATQVPVTNLTPAYLYLAPSISAYQDPDAQIDRYQTFSVFPFSALSKDAANNEILEKQLLFLLRNTFENRGYRFVSLDGQPDFVVTINANASYQTSYVPPSSIQLPVWIPGRTITSYGTTNGTFNFSTFGAGASYGWGNYQAQTTTTTYVPGSVGSQIVNRPGYTVGHYYPTIAVSTFDRGSLKNVWYGTGVGTSDNADVRVGGQLVLLDLIARFPSAQRVPMLRLEERGVVGAGLQVLTNDGNNYFPTVMTLTPHGPGEKGGLDQYDMILSVNGVATVNRPMAEVLLMMRGAPGSQVKLEVWRTGRRLALEFKRVDLYKLLK